jgi:hypothetical protein
MALSTQYQSPYGGDAFTYFIVGEVHENRYFGHATVVAYGFLNAEARHAKANFITVSLTIEASQWTKDASIAQVYGLLKTLPPFTDATDV